MTDIAKIDRQVYLLAKSYLPNLGINGVTANLIEKYLNPFTINPKPTSKEGIYQRILESAQNAHMKAGVIGGAIGGVSRLSHVLEDFNPKAVLNKYGTGWEAILDDIVEQLHPRGKIRRTPRGIWPHYCQTILSAVLMEELVAEKRNSLNMQGQFSYVDRKIERSPYRHIKLTPILDIISLSLIH